MIAIYFVAADDQAALAVAGDGPQGEETVESEVDPMALAALDADLTGRDVDDLLESEEYPRPVNETTSATVVALDRGFQRGLARDDIEAALATWLDSDDVAGADPDELSDFITDLATLCRDAGDNSGVYCWVTS